MQFNKGDGIAQLLLFFYIKDKSALGKRQELRSTRKYLFWQSVVNDQWPKLTMQVNDIEIEDLMNTGVIGTSTLKNIRIQNDHFKDFRYWKVISHKSKL